MTASWEERIASVLGPQGLLSGVDPRYEARPAQLAMARQVAHCLEEEGRLVVEAGTGTGKTLAYLVPAVLSGRKVVISTGTKTLQEQIVRKDAPLLRELLGRPLQVVALKGLSNYLCLRRLAEVRRAPRLLADGQLEAIWRWAQTTESGDRSELAGLRDQAALWAEVSSSPETRLGPRCGYFEDCFVTRMRRAAAQAQVVVVNHHLLLADLALRLQAPSAGVIPTCEALIVDEAHSLEAIATAFFGQSLASSTLAALGREVRRAAVLRDDGQAEVLCRHVEESSAELFHLLAQELPQQGESFPGGGERSGQRLRLREAPLAGCLEQPTYDLDAALEALSHHLLLRAPGNEDLSGLAERAAGLRETLALFSGPPPRGSIFWAEQSRSSLALHASPVEVGPLLRRTLLCEAVPMIFTSATLATSSQQPSPLAAGAGEPVGACASEAQRVSSLSYFCRQIGLQADEADQLVLPSPFCFARQALLYVPRDLPEPNAPEFIFRASERMSQLIDMTAGRALVLFTSNRNLQAARELLAPQLDYPLLCQGDAPRSLLLETFRTQVASVLLATASFWEGVDVAGESLSLVIIDKLPFAVPSDPLTAARLELLRQRGEDPFRSLQLPQAALSLKQGFGRLIRHRDDCGVVAVLDRRLVDRTYGRTLLAGLPACPRTSDLLRVRAFCREMLTQRAAL